MTEQADAIESTTTAENIGPRGRPADQVLVDAVRVLTEAARLTRPALERNGAASDAAGHPVWVESGRREPADWAEFVTLALAGAAANVGGIDTVLAGRPGSWEADGVRQLLTSTVGHDEEHLHGHRTEPVVVDLYVEEILVDRGVWTVYVEAQRELARRYDAIGMPPASPVPGNPMFKAGYAPPEPATEEQERQADAIAAAEERVEELREQDWTAYGQALEVAVQAAAQRLPGLQVPVVVRVDLHSFRPFQTGDEQEWTWNLADQLRTEAIDATPLPGDGRPPLDRLRPAASEHDVKDDKWQHDPEERT